MRIYTSDGKLMADLDADRDRTPKTQSDTGVILVIVLFAAMAMFLGSMITITAILLLR